MKSTAASLMAAASLARLATATNNTTLVSSEALQKLITLEDLLSGAEQLQGFADANNGNRVFGSTGHNATVDWLIETLEATGYYDVTKQPFSEIFSEGTASLTVDGAEVPADILTYTPGGEASGSIVLVNNLGCSPDDFPAEVSGAVALISRGECNFSQKSINANAAGATVAIIYNNAPGDLAGTLGGVSDDYVPTIGITQENGQAIVTALEAGEVTVDVTVDAVVEDRVTFNVIAETKEGDKENVLVLGGHTDSVSAGPGINDNGSGTIGVLRVAEALANFKVKNAVRFAFWSAEEFGLLGSYFYINSVNTTDSELAKIRAYLNFDMIASPNYVYGIYDGDGSAFNLTGPPGSDVIEADFETFFADAGSNSIPTEFSGRSDYAAFIENGIPSGGLFTGAEEIKTEEEAELFGGEAGAPLDANYHQAGDTIDNLDAEAFLLNTKAIANSVAKYALSFDSLEAVDLSKRRWASSRANFFKRSSAHGVHPPHHNKRGGVAHVHSGPCGGGSPK